MKKISIIIFSLFLFISLSKAQDKSEFPKVKIHGLTFGDYFYNASSFNAADKNLNGIDIRRIYFTGDFMLSKDFSSRFRLETHQFSGDATFGVMVKDAWLKWHNIFQGSDLIFGLSPTPAFDVSEGAWEHRYLEKTIMDLNHIVGSRDLGIDLKGNLDESGTVKYWLKLGNNSGNKPETNKYKRFYGLLEFLPTSNFLATVYADYASAPQITFNNTSMGNNSFVGAIFLNYKEKGMFSLGLESFYKSTQNGYIEPGAASLTSLNGFGISVWAYANLSEKVQLVGRFDTVDPNTNSNANKDGKSLILAGVQFNPIKHVSITPNIEVFTYQASPSNGGDKSDVTPRVSFYWQF